MSFSRDRSNDNDVKPTGKLVVENLHYDVSLAELKQLFEQIGPVMKAYIKVCTHRAACERCPLTCASSSIAQVGRQVQRWSSTTTRITPLTPRESTTAPKPKAK